MVFEVEWVGVVVELLFEECIYILWRKLMGHGDWAVITLVETEC